MLIILFYKNKTIVLLKTQHVLSETLPITPAASKRFEFAQKKLYIERSSLVLVLVKCFKKIKNLLKFKKIYLEENSRYIVFFYFEFGFLLLNYLHFSRYLL